MDLHVADTSEFNMECSDGGCCSICLEELVVDSTETLKCGHCFHLECINEWMASKRDCPNCRQTGLGLKDEGVGTSTINFSAPSIERTNATIATPSQRVQRFKKDQHVIVKVQLPIAIADMYSRGMPMPPEACPTYMLYDESRLLMIQAWNRDSPLCGSKLEGRPTTNCSGKEMGWMVSNVLQHGCGQGELCVNMSQGLGCNAKAYVQAC